MKFEVFQSDKNEKYYFNLKAGNGQIILSSQAYATKDGCMNGIESVKTNSADDNFEQKEAANGKLHFTLKAANGQIVGSSQMYEGQSGVDGGIESVKKNAPDAVIDDLTA